MLKNELISVVVCSYNNENFVIDCLNSIFEQNYDNIELLISDDCSNDITYELICDWCDKHENRFVNCFHKRNDWNVGITKNHNSILKYSKGEYIKILAADDFLLDNALTVESDFLKNNKDHEIVYGNSLIISKNDHFPLKNINSYKLFYDSIPKSGKSLTKDLLKNCFIAAPTVMYRGDTFKKYGYFREDLNFEDWEYWIRLSKNGLSIGYINDLIVAYRVYVGSNSHVGLGTYEENKYINNIITEETILSENSDFIDKDAFDIFWNRVLNTCINNNYNNFINKIINEKHFKINFKTFIKLILYKLKIYRIIRFLFFH